MTKQASDAQTKQAKDGIRKQLERIGESASRDAEAPGFLERFLSLVRETLNAAGGTIWLLRAEEPEIACHEFAFYELGLVKDDRATQYKSLLRSVAQAGKPAIVAPGEAILGDHRAVNTTGYAVLISPFRAGSQVVGLLEILMESGHKSVLFSALRLIDDACKFLACSPKLQHLIIEDMISRSVVLPPSPDSPPPLPEAKRPEYLSGLLATVPSSGGYAEQAPLLEELNHDFRREMAARLQPLLNAHIQAMPHDTYEEKKALARWVNDELRRFDLAIKCPKTGKPGQLFGDPGNHPEIGRFCIEIKEDGKRKRPVNTPQLPHLELMEAAPRREALSEWHERVGRQRGGVQRG